MGIKIYPNLCDVIYEWSLYKEPPLLEAICNMSNVIDCKFLVVGDGWLVGGERKTIICQLHNLQK